MRTLNQSTKKKTLHATLREIVAEIEEDQYMLMEYLSPVVDGCRAALSVSLRSAREASFSAEDFQRYMDVAGDSFRDISICFAPADSEDRFSIVFDGSKVYLVEDCEDPDVVIGGPTSVLRDLMDADAKMSPVDELGETVRVSGRDSRDVVVGLGLLCFPSLLRMARAGVDPSSLLAEDADAVIMAAATDMVTKIVRKWIDLHLEAM